MLFQDFFEDSYLVFYRMEINLKLEVLRLVVVFSLFDLFRKLIAIGTEEYISSIFHCC